MDAAIFDALLLCAICLGLCMYIVKLQGDVSDLEDKLEGAMNIFVGVADGTIEVERHGDTITVRKVSDGRALASAKITEKK